MKKILGSLLLIFVLVSFASCKGGDKIIVDTPSDAIANALNLADVKSGDALNVDKDTQQPYFDVRVSLPTYFAITNFASMPRILSA